MIIYLMPFLFISVFAVMELGINQNGQQTKLFFNGSFFAIIIFLAFLLGQRKLTGSDSSAYEYIYQTGIGFDRLEDGYKWISLFFQSNNYSFWSFQFVIGILTVFVATIAFLYWDSKSKFIQLLVFYSPFWYFMSFNGMRQGIATSFVYLGTVLLWHSGLTGRLIIKLLALTCFVVAYNFHHMAITVILFVSLIWILGLFKVVISSKILKLLAIILVPLLLLMPPLYSIQSSLEILAKFGLDYTSLLSVAGSSYEMSTKGLCFVIILLMMIILSKGSIKYNGLLNYYQFFIFILLMLLLIFGSGMNSMRVFDYFIPVLALFVKYLLEDRHRNYQNIILIYLFMFLAFVYAIIQNTHQIMPYLGWS